MAAAVGGALVGLVLGLALAAGDDEADPENAVRDTRSQVTQAAGLLDIVPVEYSEAVSGGRVTSPAEYRGARAALERSRTLYLEARPVVVLIDPSAARDIDAAYARLARTMASFASAATVAAQTGRLEGLLRESVGLTRSQGQRGGGPEPGTARRADPMRDNAAYVNSAESLATAALGRRQSVHTG